MAKKSVDSVPKVLEERLLIDDVDRKVLKTMENLSPHDTANIYYPRNIEKEIPTFKDIADALGVTEEKVRNSVYNIKNTWKLPDSLPTDGGRIDNDRALINALTNQHKLRWDPEIKDYRVPRIHEYNAELGLGTLYTNNKAFEGQRIFRNAMDLNESMNSVHFQGGLLPTLVSFYSKTNNYRALLTGLNKTKIASEKELDEVKTLLELSKRGPLDEKQIQNLKDYVVNTIDSLQEAAASAAYEFAPLVKDLSDRIPIHLYMSYNDDFNLSVQEDLFITSMRDILGKAKDSEAKLPRLYKDKKETQNQLTYEYIQKSTAEFILGNVENDSGFKKLVDANKSKKKLSTLINEYVFKNNELKTDLNEFKATMAKQYEADKGRMDKADFERIFRDAKERYSAKHSTLKSIGELKKHIDKYEKNKSKLANELSNMNDDIAELEQYSAAARSQDREGHAWFTKKYAIRPTDSKAMYMMLKDLYSGIYEDIFIPEVKRLAGKDLKLLLHTDREISVFVEDPATLWDWNKYPKDKLYGTILTSIPRVNRQRSNEPLGESFAELQGRHASAVAHRIKLDLKRPDRKKDFEYQTSKTSDVTSGLHADFDKRKSSAFSEVWFTSWGADGYRLQPKFTIQNTMAEGEYRSETETTWYLKLPTRHNMDVLGDLMKKGNRGTLEGKRLEKGGPTTGNVLQISHADRSVEWMFVDDKFYESIVDKYGKEINDFESKLSTAKDDASKELIKASLSELYTKVRPEIYYGMLANDLHIGVENMPGTPNNVDYIRSSQLAILQTYGVDKLKAITASEIPNANYQIGRKFVTSERGYMADPITLEKNIKMLERGLRVRGKDSSQILEYITSYVNEQTFSASTFRSEQQNDMIIELLRPLFSEMLEHGTRAEFASGNHKNMSRPEDESQALAQLFDPKYRDMGLIHAIPANGEGYSFAPITLPGNNRDIDVMLTHKMDSGPTQISSLAKQAVGIRHKAMIYLTADRHQPGVVAEKEKFAILDVGKQGPGPYPLQVGQTNSVRGSMTFGYGANKELVLPVRFFLDNVVDPMIGWQYKADMLKECHQIIKEGLAAPYKK